MQEKEGELCSFFRNFGNAEPSEKPEEISYASTGLIDLRLFFSGSKDGHNLCELAKTRFRSQNYRKISISNLYDKFFTSTFLKRLNSV